MSLVRPGVAGSDGSAPLDPLLAAHRLYAHASVWDTPFVAEMREWRPQAGGFDASADHRARLFDEHLDRVLARRARIAQR